MSPGKLIGPNLLKRQQRALRWVESRIGTDPSIRPRTPEMLQQKLVEIRLAEDHPGRGLLFDVWVGTWSPDSHQYYYPGCTDFDELYKCIDWRYNVPSPAVYAKGVGQWMQSTAHGRILYVIDLDCGSPGCPP